MSLSDYARIRELYEAAAAMDPSRRTTFLRQACADPAIRSEVEGLLQIADNATGFLSQPTLNSVGLDVAGTPAKRFAHGDLLGGRFEIQQHIATGGMGEVYRARDRNLDRDVALKVLPRHLSARADLVERLKREARAISSLNHPSICSLYDFCWHGDTGYLVMEYLEGKTLRDRIASGPCTVSELIDFAIQIAEGLVAAHARGLIHRDIKPANLFVTNRGQLKIMDFGLAKPVEETAGLAANGDGESTVQFPAIDASLTLPGVITGTIAYMSPEQACGEALDARSDLFSVGAVLYEISTGQKPFPGDSLLSVRSAILHTDPVPAIRLRPDLSTDLNRIISKALQKDKALRYGSAAALRADVEQAKRRESRREVRRLRWMAIASGVIAAGLIGAFAWVQWVRPATPITRNIVPVQLTTNSAELRIDSSEVSPDGKLLAYSDQRGVTVGPLQREDRKLLEGTSGLHVVAWTRDGQSIVLGNILNEELATVPAAGGSVRPIGSRVPNEYGIKMNGNTASFFGPDGQTRCSVEERDGYRVRDVAFSKDRSLVGTIWAAGLGPARLEIQRLSDCSRLVPDGKQTAHLTPASVDPIAWEKVGSLHWTSPTTFLAVETQFSPVADSTIWSVNVDAQKLRVAAVERIARLPGMTVFNLRATPDGASLIFLRYEVGWNVFLTETEKSGTRIRTPRRFTNFDKSDELGEWSRDGRSLIIVSDWNGALRIFRRPLDGGDGVPLPSVGKPSHVRVSGDGKWIVYASAAGQDYRASETRIMRMPITGGRSEEIFSVGRNLLTHNCAWRPEGPCIVTERRGKDTQTAFGGLGIPEYVLVSLYDPVLGKGREVARIKNAGLTAAISPDGKTIATLMGYPSRSIRLYSIEGRIIREVTVHGVTNLRNLSWAADSRSWYSGDMNSLGSTRLVRVNAEGHTSVVWDRSAVWAKSSPDGRHLAIFAGTSSSNVWAIRVK